MPQSARIWTTACPKPAGPLEDYEREYDRVTRSVSPLRSRYTEPSLFPPSCTVQRPGFLIGSRSGYWSGFTNAAYAPPLASNGKTMCQTKKSSREPACPAQHRVHLASGAAALGWPRHKDGRRSHAQSSLLQRAQRRKARSRCFKKALQKSAGISHQSWQQEASDRDSWRSSVREAICECEAERHKAEKEKRRRQKE